MSDLSVPCRAPYRGYTTSDVDETVTINVGRGLELESFNVSVPLLCQGSEYFEERLTNRDADVSSLPLSFPTESPSLFTVFLAFLKTGTLRHPNLRSATRNLIAMGFVVELFALASTFSALQFRNALLDAFILRLANPPFKLEDVPVKELYAVTSKSSSLRHMLLTAVVSVGSIEMVERAGEYVPNEFLVDCLRIASEDGVVPFWNESLGRDAIWWRGMEENVCEEYHVHEEGEGNEYMGEDDGDDDDDQDMEEDHDGDEHGGGGDNGEGGSGRRTGLEISEKTKRELAFIEEMRKLRVRY